MSLYDPVGRIEPYPCAPRDVERRWEAEWASVRRRFRESPAKPPRCA